MPTLNIEGKKVKVDDSFLQLSPEDQAKTVDEIASHLGIQPAEQEASPAAQPAPKQDRLPANDVDAAKAARDDYYSRGIYAGAYNPLGSIAKAIDAGASAAQRSPLFGWDDEAVAGARSLAGNTDYATAQQQEDAKKTAMRQQNPGPTIAGEIGGGLLMARGLPNVVAGRNLPVIGRTGAAVIEGAGYGGLTGAGEAKPGERGQGAAYGAALGGAVSGVASRVGDALASRAARRAANDAAPTAQELADASQQLYDQAYQSGVALEPNSANRMLQNMRMAGGRVNENLRPHTAGLIDDINALQGQPIDLQRFHELRQEVDLAISRATPSDERTLTRMRNVLNAFADNVTPQHVVGPADAFNTFREADQLWARRTKTQKIEDLFDLADVKSGRYSQSGMENAIRDKASQLYTRIVKRQETSFTPQETALIRQLARGNSSPALLKWVAKFAPRGIVSAGLGTGIGASVGSALGGPVGGAIGFAVPGAVGTVAARSVDNAAQRTLHAIQSAAATGNAPVLGAISNRINPLIAPVTSGMASQIMRQR